MGEGGGCSFKFKTVIGNQFLTLRVKLSKTTVYYSAIFVQLRVYSSRKDIGKVTK